MKKYVILLLFIIQGVYAQVEFKAVPSKTTLGINEKLTVEFIMNRDGDNFEPPAFNGFTASAPLQTIDPPATKKETYQKTYTYVLTPKRRGTHTIGQASIEIDGKIYKTVPFKVTVTAATDNGTAPDASATAKAGSGIYVVAEVSNKNPYVNEGVSVQYKLYVDEDTDVADWNPLDSPRFSGFWSHSLQFTKIIEEGMFKGKPHRYITFIKTVVYPEKSGKIEIEPVSVNVIIRTPTSRVNALGRNITATVQKVYSSEKVIVDVKPLPQQGKPATFKGAVGDFTFDVAPSKTTAASGESFRLNVSVSGKGNFKIFNLPQPVVPAALEMYDPEQTDNTNVTLSGLQGTFTNSYTVIPQFKGQFKIKPVPFSFFDPKLGVYRTIYSKEITIDVPTGPDATAAAYQDAAGTKKEAPEDGKDDIAGTDATSDSASASPLLYVLVGLLLGAGIAVVLLRRKAGPAAKKAKEPVVKQPEPHNLAKTFLAEAKLQLGNKEPFYIALEKALHNFLKAKLAIETAQMTKQTIRDLLVSKGADRTTVEQYIQVMDNCAFARYAPSTGVEMQRDYDHAETAINSLEKQL